MRFEIQLAVFELFPGMAIPAVLAEEIHAPRDCAFIQSEWRRVWSETAANAGKYGKAQTHPRVKPWRDRFQDAGYSGKKFPSSIEAMLRRCLKGGEPFSINALVDLYNIVSLRHLVPAGGFDVDQLEQETLELRVTRAADTFHALDSDEIEDVPEGEVAYTTGTDILTRHFVWRQSRRGLLTNGTRRAIFMAEVLGELGQDVAREVLADLSELIEDQLSARTISAILNADNPSVEFER